MMHTLTPASAPLAVLVAHGVVSVLVVDEPPTTECPTCEGKPNWPTMRIEGGSRSCWYCNRTFTFNMMREPGPDHCECKGSREKAHECAVCAGSGRVPLLGPVQIATPDTPPPDYQRFGDWLAFRDYNSDASRYWLHDGHKTYFPIPEPGSVVAVTTIEACVPVADLLWVTPDDDRGGWSQVESAGEVFTLIAESERQFQEFPPGAWCLILTGTQPIGEA